MPARPATAPTTMIPGKSPSSPGRMSAPRVSSVPCHCAGSGPRDAEQHGGRRPGRPPGGAQLAGDRDAVGHSHHHDDRRAPRSEGAQDRPVRGFGVTGDHQERGREPAMRDGDPREHRRGNRAGDPGNDLAGNAGRGERERLFPAAAEDERIAALETHDSPATARLADHQPVDRVLPDRRTSGALAHEEPLRARGVAQRRGLDERVVEHEVRLAEPPHRLEREELRITGAGADERNEARHFTGSAWIAGATRPARSPGPAACAAARAADCRASYSEFSASSSSGRRASIGT